MQTRRGGDAIAIGGRGRGRGHALFYPGVGDKRVNHEIAAKWHMISEHRWRGGGARAYTWLRERESGERMKASEEGAGMVECLGWAGEPGRQLENMEEEGRSNL